MKQPCRWIAIPDCRGDDTAYLFRSGKYKERERREGYGGQDPSLRLRQSIFPVRVALQSSRLAASILANADASGYIRSLPMKIRRARCQRHIVTQFRRFPPDREIALAYRRQRFPAPPRSGQQRAA